MLPRERYAPLKIFGAIGLFFLEIPFGDPHTPANPENAPSPVRWQVEAGGYYQTPLVDNRVHLPLELMDAEAPSPRATDNPLYHGGFYLDILSSLKVAKGFFLTGRLVGEHRGFSYGVYNTENMIAYPEILVTLDRTLEPISPDLSLHLALGNQRNVRLYEGLDLYNLDAQGWDASLLYRKLRFTHYHLGDLQRGWGLNISDSYDHFFSLENWRLHSKVKADIRVGHFYYDESQGFKASLGLTYRKNTRIYTQAGYRLTGPEPLGDYSRWAGVAGFVNRKSKHPWIWSLKGEARYYGRAYNRNRINSVSYRSDSGAFSLYGSSIGDHLYPLRLYENPFGQWAVYTEYQEADISSFVIEGHGQYFFWNHFYGLASLDLTTLSEEIIPDFVYPFYFAGIGWEPVRGNRIQAGLTNKGMNLDRHYPTHYYYAYPYFHLVLERRL